MAHPDKDRVVECINDIIEAVQSVAEFEQRVATVFDEEDAMNQLKGLARWPAAVVQYEGMKAVEGQQAGNWPNAATLIMSILVVNQGQRLIKTDTKVSTLLLLTQLRKTLLGRTAPSGHKWKFVVEAAASEKNGLIFWVQRWQCNLVFQPD